MRCENGRAILAVMLARKLPNNIDSEVAKIFQASR